MIKGTVTYVDGTAVGVQTGDDAETRVGLARGTTKVSVLQSPDGERKDARPGYISQIEPGDRIEVRGANPGRADSVFVTKGSDEDKVAVREFNARKVPPRPATVTAAPMPENAPKVLPAEILSTRDEAPPEVPHGERRAWREGQAAEKSKELGEEYVRQEEDPEGIERAPAGDADDDQSEHPSHAQLKEMTKAELEAEAKREGVELPSGGTKDEYLKAFTAHHRKAARARRTGG